MSAGFQKNISLNDYYSPPTSHKKSSDSPHVCLCNSIASVPLLAPTWARTRDPLYTSTTVTLEAPLPIAPQKPQPLQSKRPNYFKVSARVASPTGTLLACTSLTS